jgi:prolyl 4-hydroxylase
MASTQEFAFSFVTEKGEKCCTDCSEGNGEVNGAGDCVIEINGCGDSAEGKFSAEVGADGSITGQAASPGIPKFRSKVGRRRDDSTIRDLSTLPESDSANAANCPDLKEWIMKSMPWKGYYPLCIYKSATNESMLEIMAFVDGVALPKDKVRYGQLPKDASVRTFRKTVEGMLPMQRTDTALASSKKTMQWIPQQWSAFTTGGHKVKKVGTTVGTTPSAQDGTGVLLVFEGGQWLHPGIEIGFKRSIRAHDTEIVLETLALQPLVFSIQNFIRIEECDHIQEEAAPHVADSGVSLMDHDEGAPATDFRTSKTHFLQSRDALLKNFDKRVANLTRVPVNHQEDLQVLRYDKNGRYDQHLDFWDPKSYTDPGVVNMIHAGYKNRMATVFCYLSDTVGGYTAFPLAYDANDAAVDAQFPDKEGLCPYKLRIHPQRGKVIIFYSLLPDGNGDELSQHTACPLAGGTKWSANKWVWNEPQRFVS